MRGEELQDAIARLLGHRELGQELPVEIGVAEPDHRPGEPDRIERRAQHLDHLGGPVRSVGANQLDICPR